MVVTSTCQYLHRESKECREKILRKLAAYNVLIQSAVIAQGILVYLAITKTPTVWTHFGSWLRTICAGVIPSEQVVMLALRNTLPEFLAGSPPDDTLQKFIREKVDLTRAEGLRLVA